MERRTEQHRIPKGQGLTQHAMEHFYRWGVADKVRAARVLPQGFSLRGITAYLTLSSEYWYSPPFREVVNTYYFQDSERLPQYLTESVLRTRMAELPSIHILVGWAAETVEQDDTGVRVGIVSQQGERDVIEALMLCLAGGLLGIVFTFLVFNLFLTRPTGTMNFRTFSEVLFNFRMTPQLIAGGLACVVVAPVDDAAALWPPEPQPAAATAARTAGPAASFTNLSRTSVPPRLAAGAARARYEAKVKWR